MMTRKTFYKTLLICFSLLSAVTLMLACSPLLESQHGNIAPGSVSMKTQFDSYSSDIDTIQVIMTNASGGEISFGSMWSVEKADGDKWMTIPFEKDAAWDSLLHILANGGTCTFTVHTQMLDFRLTDGRYRIVKIIDDIPVAAEFTVGASNISADSPYGYKPFESLPENYSTEAAIADGVVMLDADGGFENVERFFSDIDAGASSQMRYGVSRNEGLELTDVIVEYKLGTRQILWREMVVGGEVAERYYGFITVEGDNICLSDTADGANYIMLDGFEWDGREGIIDRLKTYNAQQELAYSYRRSAIYWSDDGMRQVTLYSDAPLSFAYSELYKSGGSVGHMGDVKSVEGITAIVSVEFTEDGVIFTCETENGNALGYVEYDTSKMTVTDSEMPRK